MFWTFSATFQWRQCPQLKISSGYKIAPTPEELQWRCAVPDQTTMPLPVREILDARFVHTLPLQILIVSSPWFFDV